MVHCNVVTSFLVTEREIANDHICVRFLRNNSKDRLFLAVPIYPQECQVEKARAENRKSVFVAIVKVK